MSHDPWDHALRELVAPDRELTPTEAEIQRALGIATTVSRRQHRLRRLAAVAAVAVAACVSAFAVPPTRAAVNDVSSSVFAWLTGADGSAPGRPLEPSDSAPDWIRQTTGEKRVIAEAGGVNLVVVRETDGTLTAALGSSFGQNGTAEDWREQLAAHAIVVLGPASIDRDRPFDDQWRRPLFGLTARNVTRVALYYISGPPTVQKDVRGGFGLLADAKRPLRTLVAYDTTGRSIGKIDMRAYELRLCHDVRGCPPGQLVPQRSPG